MVSQCNGIFTDQSIFRDSFREIGQFQSTWVRFGEDNTIERLSMTFRANGKRQNETFPVCLQLSVQ